MVSFAVSRCWRCGLSPCSSYFVSEADLVRNRSGFKNLSLLLINWINRTRLTPRLIPPNSFSLHQLRTKIRRTVPLSNRQPDRNFSRKSSDHFHASIRATSNPWLAILPFIGVTINERGREERGGEGSSSSRANGKRGGSPLSAAIEWFENPIPGRMADSGAVIIRTRHRCPAARKAKTASGSARRNACDYADQ